MPSIPPRYRCVYPGCQKHGLTIKPESPATKETTLTELTGIFCREHRKIVIESLQKEQSKQLTHKKH